MNSARIFHEINILLDGLETMDMDEIDMDMFTDTAKRMDQMYAPRARFMRINQPPETA